MANSDPMVRLIRQYQSGVPGTEGTVTSSELATLMDCGAEKARKVLHELIEVGKLEPCHIQRRNRWGEIQRIKGYRVV